MRKALALFLISLLLVSCAVYEPYGSHCAITLTDAGFQVEGSGARAAGRVLTIEEAGIYVLRGSMRDGRIVVDAGKKDVIRIVLEGVSLRSSSSAPLYAKQAGSLTLSLAPGTENRLEDGEAYTEGDAAAAVHALCDLTVNGTGALYITARHKNGLQSRRALYLSECVLTVDAVRDGIVGKSLLHVSGGSFHIRAGDDALHADERIVIEDGRFDIPLCNEGLESPVIELYGGEGNILADDDGINIAGGGVEKGPLQGAYLAVHGGVWRVDAKSDGIDSNGSVYLHGGELYISGAETGKGDGAIDYDGVMEVYGGTLAAAGGTGISIKKQTAPQNCAQPVLWANLPAACKAGSVLSLKSDTSEVLLSYTPPKHFRQIYFSSPALSVGEVYSICVDNVTVFRVELTDMVTLFNLD